ncbi:MAG TPA: hypothetical protein VF278_04970 [Pirellulales bacterium]
MSSRKKRFEMLEERRLLSVWGEAASAAAVVAPAPSTASAGEYSGIAAPDDDSSAEYATAPPASAGTIVAPSAPADAPASAATSNATASANPAAAYNRGYADSYSADTAYTKPASPATPTQPQTGQPATVAPNLPPLNPNLDQHATVDALAVSPPLSADSPAAAASPPIARSPAREAGPLDLEAGAPIALPSAGGEQTLVSPVAEGESAGQWPRIGDRALAALAAEELASSAPLHLVAEPARAVLIGDAGAPFAALEKSIDAVFERLDQLGGELAEHGQASRVGQWVVVATGACAAFEYARARYREGSGWQAATGGPVFYEPRLRRRWFATRRKTQ